MAFQNKTIYNPKRKQNIRFIRTGSETDGKFLEMEATYLPNASEQAEHYHPQQNEEMYIISGELMVKLGGICRILREGDYVRIPPGQKHAMWNHTDTETIVNWKISPALNMEHLVETAAGLANEGKTNQHGMPNLMRSSLMHLRFSDVFRMARPHSVFQDLIMYSLAPFAFLLGYRPKYERYID